MKKRNKYSSNRQDHYVPVWYLKQFESRHNSKCTVIDLREKKIFKASAIDVLKIRGFYAYLTKEGEVSNELDGVLIHYVETSAAPLFKKLCSRVEFPTKDEWCDVASFLALLDLRTPYFRQTYLGIGQVLLNTLIRDQMSSEDNYNKYLSRCGLPYDKALEVYNNSVMSLQIPQSEYLYTMLYLYPMVYRIIQDMVRRLVMTTWRCLFVTSDNPMARYVCDGIRATIAVGNLSNADIEVVMPISPMCCLSLRHKGNNDEVISIPDRRVAYYNTAQGFSCSRYVVSQEDKFCWLRDDGSISRDIEEYRDKIGDMNANRLMSIMYKGEECSVPRSEIKDVRRCEEKRSGNKKITWI